MRIDSIAKKAKPPGYINLGTAISLIAALYNKDKDVSDEAANKKAYRLLLKELRKKFIPIRIREKEDKTNRYYSYAALGNAVWENERKSLFTTGRITYENKVGEYYKGILFLKKSFVVKFASQLSKEIKALHSTSFKPITEATAEILWRYVERLANAIERADIRRMTTDNKVHLYIGILQAKAFVTALAHAHGWKFTATEFNIYFPSSKFQQLGIAQEGRRPKNPDGNSKAKNIVKVVEAEIRKEIAIPLKNPHQPINK